MMEENLLKQFKKYAHRDVVEKNTDWHWLSVAQHYGLPTRLLDWTYSPMIALHFATCDIPINPDNDAAVWRINYSNVHDKLQTRQTDSLRALGARIFSVDSLAETMPDLTELTGHGGGGYETAVFFEPPALDDRIINQFAYFSAISDPFLAFDDWLADPNISPDVNAMKVIIPHDLLWQVRDKLDQSNINERVLMTGLDGLCSWLRRHYTPRKSVSYTHLTLPTKA